MLGLQLETKALTQKVVEDCFDQGILLGWTLHSDTLVRLAPPLIIDHEVLDEVLTSIRETVKKHVAGA